MWKQWHSIEAAWELMARHAKYARVGLFRLDVVYRTPIDISSLGDAVVPNFAHWTGVNDRAFYGSWDNARVWATQRIPTLARYLSTPEGKRAGMHSESFMKYLTKNMTLAFASICFQRVRANGKIDPEYSRPATNSTPARAPCVV